MLRWKIGHSIILLSVMPVLFVYTKLLYSDFANMFSLLPGWKIFSSSLEIFQNFYQTSSSSLTYFTVIVYCSRRKRYSITKQLVRLLHKIRNCKCIALVVCQTFHKRGIICGLFASLMLIQG